MLKILEIMTQFTYNSKSSADFGLHIESKQIYDAPERERNFQAIPGRSGDLILSNKRFSNVQVSYTCFFKTENKNEVAERMKEIKAWLYADCDEYHKLSDSYDTEYFRWATPSASLSVDEQFNQIGQFTVTFNCRPFKYSNKGDEYITREYQGMEVQVFTASPATFVNPEAFECLPFIKVSSYGNFELTITDSNAETGSDISTWVIRSKDENLADDLYSIDCEKMSITLDGVNIMDKFEVNSSDGGFPVWKGNHKLTISWTTPATSFLIIPKWRTL